MSDKVQIQKTNFFRRLDSSVTLCLSAFLLATLCVGSISRAADPTQVRVRLKSGGFIAGTLVNSAIDGKVAVQCDAFAAPLELDVGAIRSIDELQRDKPTEAAPQTFLLSGGNSIAGKLLRMDADSVTVQSTALGEVTFPRSKLREFSDSRFAGRLLYSGPRSGVDWTSTDKPEDWSFEAGAIATSKAGACIVGDVKLATKSEVHIALSWTKSPEFVLSLGCSQDSKVDDNQAAVRLEIWDGALAMVREVGGSADVALISNFSAENNRLNLIVYLDQAAGIAAVATQNGKLLERLELKSDKATPTQYAKLSFHGQENYQSVFRLERFEVREWDGHLPDGNGQASAQIVGADGQAIEGRLGNFDPNTGDVQVLRDGQEPTLVKLADVRRALFDAVQVDAVQEEKKEPDPATPEATAKDKPEEKKEDSNAPLESPFAEPQQSGSQKPDSQKSGVQKPDAKQIKNDPIEIELSDHTRLSGKWLKATENKIQFQAADLDQALTFDITNLIGLLGNSDPYSDPTFAELKETPKGLLQTASCELTGLVKTEEGATSKTILWLAESAAAPVLLAENANGKIDFAPSKSTTPSAKARATAEAQAQMLGGRRAAANAAGERVKAIPRARRLTIGLEFRSGDVVEGTVTAISEKGVTFTSTSTPTTFVPHAEMESVTLRPNRDAVNETPQKLERLMIVPRSMKADPPTHMLVSTNGDYLRGRLISMNEAKTVMEVRLENVEIPTEQIAQIYWLHDRSWEVGKDENGKEATDKATAEANAAAAPNAPSTNDTGKPFQVHTIRKDGRGLTFVPTGTSEGKLIGVSALLGDCAQPIAELKTIFFGRDVGAQARALKKELWKLSLAQLPKVYQEGEGSSGEPESPLVGKPAPDFTLLAIDDSKHKLSQYAGKVVVLDFWASWCGPCMKTMPEIDRVVKEVGENQVELIAVNLQEGKDRINTAVARLAIAATVLMDIDGEVAQLYQASAIPQTVIIDRNGVVSHLFVGGGNKFVEQFSAALKATLEAK